MKLFVKRVFHPEAETMVYAVKDEDNVSWFVEPFLTYVEAWRYMEEMERKGNND